MNNAKELFESSLGLLFLAICFFAMIAILFVFCMAFFGAYVLLSKIVGPGFAGLIIGIILGWAVA